MIEICCGAMGALAVIAAFLLGAAGERRLRGRTAGTLAQSEENEEEKRVLLEEQQAFEDMLHYNMDTAYGMKNRGGVLLGGERE